MIDCATLEAWLVDLLDDALPPEQASEATQHLATCRACRSATRSARLIHAAYAELPAEDVPDAIADDLLTRARDELEGPGAPGAPDALGAVRSSRWWIALAAAAAILLIVSLWQPVGPSEEPAPPATPDQDRVAELLREGDALRDAGEHELAMAPYVQALRLTQAGSTRTTLQHRIGEFHLHMGRYEAALAHLAQVLDGAPGYPQREQALLQRAEALEGLGRLPEAVAAYLEYATEFPEQREAAELRVRGLEGLENVELLESLRSLGYTR